MRSIPFIFYADQSPVFKFGMQQIIQGINKFHIIENSTTEGNQALVQILKHKPGIVSLDYNLTNTMVLKLLNF